MKAFYHPLAEKDIREALGHYQAFDQSLGEEFLNEIDRCVKVSFSSLFVIE
jgi:hypothetical protein